MRFIALLFLVTLSYASQYPHIFSSTGDEIYENMQKYQQIKDLDIYKDRPELLEAYCMDANVTMQTGLALDKLKDDPEEVLDKGRIKSYAKELRVLSKQNEMIIYQLGKDIQALYKKRDFKSLEQISQAGFTLSPEMMDAIKEDEKKEKFNKAIDKLNTDTGIQKPVETASAYVTSNKSTAPAKQESAVTETPAFEEVNKKLTELEYYTMNLSNLKDELYRLREADKADLSEHNSSSINTKVSCLNDITAINYWMIKVLESKNDDCSLRDAIKQMKAYDKASMHSCGRESMRYVEWHSRIKPYVGRRLFEAEAGCTR